MGKQGTLKINIVGDASRLQSALNQSAGMVGKFGKVAAGAALGGVALLGGALVGIGTFALKGAIEVDKAMDIIRTGTGATGADLTALGEDFKAVYGRVPTDAAAAGKAIADLSTRTGLQGKALQDLATAELQLARITGSDVGGLIASTTRLFGDWSIATENQTTTLDQLFKTSQATGIGVDQLASQVVEFGAPLRQLGFDFDTATAMMGKWEKEGVNTSTILSGLKQGLGRFAAAGKDPVKALQATIEAMKTSGTAAEANLIAIEAFGKRAGPDLAAAAREGRFDLDLLMDSIANSKETINSAAQDTYSFGERWQIVKQKMQLALLPIGNFFMEQLEKLGSWVEGHMPEIEKWIIGTWERIRKWGEEHWPAIKEKGREVWEKIQEKAGEFAKWWDEHKGAIAEGFQNILTAASDLVSWVTSHWPEISGALEAGWKVMKIPLWAMYQQMKLIYEVTAAAVAAMERLGILQRNQPTPQAHDTNKGGVHNAGSSRYVAPAAPAAVRAAQYDVGGVLEPGLTLAVNNTGRPEYVVRDLPDAGGVTVHVHGSVISNVELSRVVTQAVRDARMLNGSGVV